MDHLKVVDAAAAAQLKAERIAAATGRDAAAARECDLREEKAELEEVSARLREDLETLREENRAQMAVTLAERERLEKATAELERATRKVAELEEGVRAVMKQVRFDGGDPGTAVEIEIEDLEREISDNTFRLSGPGQGVNVSSSTRSVDRYPANLFLC